MLRHRFRRGGRACTSFIVAKSFRPLWSDCNPGVVLLLPPSLVRLGALRNIFIHSRSDVRAGA